MSRLTAPLPVSPALANAAAIEDEARMRGNKLGDIE